MDTGQFLIYALFLLDIIVFGAYLMSIGNGKSTATARNGAWAMLAVSAVAVAYLVYLFLTDQFKYEYVRGHSATTMPWIYKLSALWAGQDGTFLLWVFLISAVGVILAYTMKEYEAWTMLYLKAMEMIVIIMMFYKNPFAMVEQGSNVAEGMGLNPLLMNPWMVSHPPIMFIGYAAAAAPFCIFLAGASLGDPMGWVRRARGWVIGAWAILGVGIYLGMYWSYEVLGWGGYWAWDPVENASLFSWIILGGAAHGILLQPYRKGFVLWNAVMVTLGYVMIIFSTFLTRSGVLADVSLHSFQGLDLYYPLLFSILITVAISVILIVKQAKLLSQEEKTEPKSGARPLFLSWAVYIFAIFFIFVFVGTNHPLFESMMGKNPSPVQTFYYNATSFIPGIPAAILIFLTPMIFQQRKGEAFPIAPTVAGGAAAVAVAISCFLAGVKHPAHIALAACSAAAVLSSVLYMGILIVKRNKSYASYMAHLGIALMLLGFIPSSMASKTDRAVLDAGESMVMNTYAGGPKEIPQSPHNEHAENTAAPKRGANIDITLKNIEQVEHGDAAEIVVKKGSSDRDVILHFIAKEAQRKRINTPFILRGIAGDLYIAPIQVVRQSGDSSGGDVLVLKKGEPADIGNSINATFESFDLAKMRDGIVGINLTLRYGDKTEQLVLDYGADAEGPVHGQTSVKDGEVELTVTGIDASSGTVRLEKKDLTGAGEAPKPAIPMATAVFQISTKPWIGLIWLGMILLSIGSFIAMGRRFRTARNSSAAAE